LRIVVLGNSVALRIRPPRAGANERTYAEWLADRGYQVHVVAQAGVILTEAIATLDDDAVSRFPDCVILNHGVVESCLRYNVRWINNQCIRNYYLNGVFSRPYVPDSAASRLRLLFWRALNGGIRRAAALTGIRWRWTSRAEFVLALEHAIAVLLKETGAHVIVLGINPTTLRVERQLPGSQRELAETNAAMGTLCERLGSRVSYVEPASYLEAGSIDVLVPDGIHFSAEGHRRTADALHRLLEQLPAAGAR
jgi:hypothetical protein